MVLSNSKPLISFFTWQRTLLIVFVLPSLGILLRVCFVQRKNYSTHQANVWTTNQYFNSLHPTSNFVKAATITLLVSMSTLILLLPSFLLKKLTRDYPNELWMTLLNIVNQLLVCIVLPLIYMRYSARYKRTVVRLLIKPVKFWINKMMIFRWYWT